MKFDKNKELAKLKSSASRPLFMVVEGNYYLHRAYSRMGSLTNAEGIPTGGVYGFLQMFSSDYTLLKPDYVAVSFDVPGLNFRHQISADYKFNDPTDIDRVPFNTQLLILVRLCKLLGIPVLFVQGVESDDVVGALATQANELCGTPVNVVLMTGDKDLNQFVNSRVVTIDTKSEGGWIGTSAAVKKKFGVAPSQIADYLALMGDSNDGIKGVPGIGPDKARKLLEEFGSLSGILGAKNLGKWSKYLPPTVLASLRRDYALSRIRTDINVHDYAPFCLRPPHPVYLQQALNALGVSKLSGIVQSQLTAASLAGSSLFDDSAPPSLVTDESEWAGLMGRLWESSVTEATPVKFKESHD